MRPLSDEDRFYLLIVAVILAVVGIVFMVIGFWSLVDGR